jgi:flagellar export protein FliJ
LPKRHAIVEETHMVFQFRLQAVLRVRQHERETQRQAVAAARACEAEQTAARDLLVDERADVIRELRQINDGEGWTIGQVIDRRRHAEQLGQLLSQAGLTIVAARSRVASSLQHLIAADQSVKVLERLAERQRIEFQQSQARSEAREFDDILNSNRRAA